MSIVLFKDGEPGVFEPNEMDYLLKDGWSTEKNHDAQIEEKTNEDQKEDESKEETPEDVRQLAKKAGIKGWENKRIKTLKLEMEYEQQA